MAELKVGEKVTITLEVVEHDDCDDCFFNIDGTCYNPTRNGWADGFQCEAEDRSDHERVTFKEAKE